MKKDFAAPILVLTVICLIVSGALAIGNAVTRPVIQDAAAERAEEARKEILPNAEEFVLLEIEGLPKTITEVYGTSNNAGFIFVITVHGYGGEIELACGIDNDGRILKCMTLAHKETKGLGTLVFDKEDEYAGKDKNLDGIDAVSGATITSTAYQNGIRDAFEAFEMIMMEEARP